MTPGVVNEYADRPAPDRQPVRERAPDQFEVRSCDYPMDPLDFTLLWPLWSHLSYSKEVTYQVHHSPAYPSRLILPVVAEG